LFSSKNIFAAEAEPAADYTVRIKAAPIEIAPNEILSTITYNGQFPGPLIRFQEGREVTVDIFNETDTPEQLHWHGQIISTDVDGAAEEGTPYIPAQGHRRIRFTPKPSGLRFYHTHNRAGADLSAGQYSGQVGPVYIEPKENPGRYDREVFVVLKEFEPTLSRGGDMPQDFLSPSTTDKVLKETGESSMKAPLAKGMPHGYEVGYKFFTINGRMLGHGEPIRVKRGERVLFHILNGSATEIRSLALPGHSFEVIALDGNPVPNPVHVPVLWLGTAERISAIVEMNHPGVWIMGDLADDDRRHGMGIVVEYANQRRQPQWVAPGKPSWDYPLFGKAAAQPAVDQSQLQKIDMVFEKVPRGEGRFNSFTVNGKPYPHDQEFVLKQGTRYRLVFRNRTDDAHPMHLHRHLFEIAEIYGKATAGIVKDTVVVPSYGRASVDFVADQPGLALFH